MVNRQCAQWASAVCAVVWSVVVLWGSPASGASPELKGKFEVVKGEVSTHTPGKVKLIEFADFYCPHCHHFEEAALPILDRKSTRLNSSHSSISYAVFCLKKK